ncbi:MAG: ABC transporter permease [Defluviitaleaceae bacterium]|nr:ABC transporter permease [Defluviitaleaceae bacterium]
MKLTARLAYSQITANRKRTVWTLLGIVLSVSMITAVYGFAAGGLDAMHMLAGEMRAEYYTMIYIIGAVLSAIIFASSVIVMTNAFRVSAGQRMSQFGILKSVGATSRQISQTIVYEGIWLSTIGIPAGVMVGLLVQYIGVRIANVFLVEINVMESNPLIFGFIVAWQAILAAVLVGFFTVFISAWLPARKAARLSAIDAIRKESGTKVKTARKNTGRLVSRLFGFEGALAAKSLMRSKRNFRATVVSLTISIVMFVGASSFGTHLNRMARLVLPTVDADVIGDFFSQQDHVSVFDEAGETVDSYVHYLPLEYAVAEQITARLREFPGASVIGVGSNVSRTRVTGTVLPTGMETSALRQRIDPENLRESLYLSFALVSVDALLYAELCRRAGVPHGSNILINYMRWRDEDRWVEFAPFNFDYQTVGVMSGNDIIEVPLHGELRGDVIPGEVLYAGRYMAIAVVPELDAKSYHWFAQTDDPGAFTSFMFDVIFEHLTDTRGISVGVRMPSSEQSRDRAVIRLVMVFTYGFVGMLTLIGLTNVISTISTNVRSRSREFAVLQSVGMTHGGLNRMLNLESILCSFKSLVYGIPLGIAASYFIYWGVIQAVDFDYVFPVAAILQCVLAVFIITWVTMRYAAARLRGGSLVDSIRET